VRRGRQEGRVESGLTSEAFCNKGLLSDKKLYILRAMKRLLILAVGIVWASLLLISWGGAEDVTPQQLQAIQLKNLSS
jgi:hypothetical protein